MSWAKLDDQILGHPKIAAVGALGFAVHCAGIVYCAQYLTDGKISARAAGRLLDFEHTNVACTEVIEDGAPGFESLIEVGLWHATGHDCPDCPEVGAGWYFVHDFGVYNPTRAQVLAEREAGRERQRRARDRRGSNGDVTRDVRRESRRDSRVSASDPSPTRTPITKEDFSTGDLSTEPEPEGELSTSKPSTASGIAAGRTPVADLELDTPNPAPMPDKLRNLTKETP